MKSVLSRISPLPKCRHHVLQIPVLSGTFQLAWQLRSEQRAMLKIHCMRDRTVVFVISGHLDAGSVNALCQVVDAEPLGGVLVLDLTDLVLADRDAVRFLRQYEARGRVVLRNCPAYVRTGRAAENDQP